jgi:hypothetical protein
MMKSLNFAQITGVLFILGAALVNIPYTALIANFDYPDILRQPAGEVLAAFEQGGSSLILTWLAFAWSGLPILLAMLLLPKALGGEKSTLLRLATTFGVIGAAAQMIGLLRWVFVVPGLAQAYTAPQAGEITKEATVQIFQAFHQFGGVLLGEHIGQVFTILWMVMVCAEILRLGVPARWVGWLGLVSAGIYFLGQGELLATVMPGFPVVGPAGLVGSLLWLAWMAVLGAYLMFKKAPVTNRVLAQA